MLDPSWRQGGEKSIHPTAALCGRDVTVCAIYHHPLLLLLIVTAVTFANVIAKQWKLDFYKVSAIQRRHAKARRVYFANSSWLRKNQCLSMRPRSTGIVNHVCLRWHITFYCAEWSSIYRCESTYRKYYTFEYRNKN